ncbi:MAG: response regulator [Alphaproteobacteria bacterium]|nr:response regulator [Alphaproteobacteria bacterium]MBU1514554.1 response regulator [Alphaproteobacteria bacterium]MBU2096814.1 response regulator [Alphaproteobacteria bacterium]MBU2153441.1 response regulator [Alphaproteobacteria bacterium]MBU2306054.1 response regulator [Alphaproteobacteria bacterium]
MTETTLIAVVEDDPEIRALVSGLLGREGFEVAGCAQAGDLDRVMERRRVDLVLLDLMLPGEDGLSVCRRLVSAPVATPVIMVTAKGDDFDRILGLELGADDYVAKPFNPRELVARVRAVLRRTREAHSVARPMPRETYRFAGWTLEAAGRRLTDRHGGDVELTGGEFDLLLAFVTHPQRVLSREQLLDWTRGRDATPFDRTIDVQLSRLRRKLGDKSRQPEMVRTIRGGGYLFAPPVIRV